jgi:hypothetical protein
MFDEAGGRTEAERPVAGERGAKKEKKENKGPCTMHGRGGWKGAERISVHKLKI